MGFFEIEEQKEAIMSGSVYVVKEIVGTSAESWEDAARQAIETVDRTLVDLRIGEVVKQDVTLKDGKVISYRVRLNISFRYRSVTSIVLSEQII
jgi:hypothetical protein